MQQLLMRNTSYITFIVLVTLSCMLLEQEADEVKQCVSLPLRTPYLLLPLLL